MAKIKLNLPENFLFELEFSYFMYIFNDSKAKNMEMFLLDFFQFFW